MNETLPDMAPRSQEEPKRSGRVSLACVLCRSHHIKCDARMPSCTRCTTEEKLCVYPKSRRGRPRRQPAPSPAQENGPEPIRTIDIRPSFPSTEASSNNSSTEDGQSDAGTRVSDYSDGLSVSISEQLFSLYYSFFHAAHPCVLPQHAMRKYLVIDSEAVQLLYSVMQYIGSLFAPSVQSEPLKLKVDHALNTLRSSKLPITSFDVQAVLLFSIATYWCDGQEIAKELMDEAIRMALRLGMNRRGYAVEHGRRDVVLEESWRRTWWQIYITDAHIAGGTHTFPFRTSYLEMDVGLPCEEDNYELGVSFTPGCSYSYVFD